MPHATLALPSLLQTVLDGRETLHVSGDTLDDALEDAYRQLPTLRVHLCDETGKLRRHVLCFLNDVNSRWLSPSERRLKDGDEITILQAVSGG